MNPIKDVDLNCTGDWRKFATTMFALEDADPGYVLLKRAKLPYATKLRYVLAWCTFYNPALAAIACQYEGKKFYAYLHSVYPTAQRASERRHFRGKAGLLALEQWQHLYPRPEAMIEDCYADTYKGVRHRMEPMSQMGDYFYWKLADIWDTVFDKPVDFTGCERYMPKVPKQGASLIYALEDGDCSGDIHLDSAGLVEVVGTITKHISKLKYTVKPGRKLALQESETVCCVFKQHVHGDYKFGFRSAKAAKRLLSVMDAAPKTAGPLFDGLQAGGIWTDRALAHVGSKL